jgi:hypothetical protein
MVNCYFFKDKKKVFFCFVIYRFHSFNLTSKVEMSLKKKAVIIQKFLRILI